MTALQDDPDPIDGYVEQALKAFADVYELDQLHAAYRLHTSAISPLALARRGIGELPAEDRTDTAKRIAFGFARINAALFERERALEVRW